MESLTSCQRLISGSSVIAGAWPSANRAIFVPFVLATPFPIARLWWANGTVSGNVDCGIYTLGGAQLGSVGSTPQAGANVVQSAALALLLAPGSYYMALALSSATGQVFRFSGLTNSGGLAVAGVMQQASALPLPSSATLVAASSSYVPVFGFTSSSVI